MAVMMLMTARRDIMGKAVVPLTMRAVGWATTALMGMAAIVMTVQLF
jgi:Mn2+/Fe2+ NRAMP family transporter